MGAGFSQIYAIVVLVGTVAATDLATDTTHMTRRLEATEQVLTASDSAVLATELTSSCGTCANVIVLSDGTYTHTQTFVIDRDVTLRAQNQHGAILDGENARQVINIKGGTVVIEGLEITKGRNDFGGGMRVSGANTQVAVTNTEISGNTATFGGGGIAINGGTLSVVSSQINNNQATSEGGGVHIQGGTSTFTSCEISSNTARYGYGGGVYVADGMVSFVLTTVLLNSADSNSAVVSFAVFTQYPEFYKSSSATVTVDSPSVPDPPTTCGANTDLNAGVCEIASTACGADTTLNATKGVCEISSPCPTTEVVASPSTDPPNGLHLESQSAMIMFGQEPECTIKLDAGKLVSSCQIAEPNSGRRLQEHDAEVSSLTAENGALVTKNEALVTENDALRAKIALLEASK